MIINNLKRFAKEARIKLLNQVGSKLEFLLTHDSAELRGKQKEIEQLKLKIAEQSKEQVIETVAYTWFNRLMALRFMDANGYTLPKVVTPLSGMTNPEILQKALGGNIEPELKLDRQRLSDLLDGKSAANDAHTEAYKILLVASCNQWHTTMPFMFERISDYTELLLPDDLLSDYSIVADIRKGMTDEDCQQEELIGWLYQFYISDKKDDVFEGLKKNIKITAENIPAATQLFTPRWIVRYMVENTLGKLWLTLKPNSKLRQCMPYYIEAPEGNVPAPLPEGIIGVTDITFLDPCQGSGHVLVYAFDLFTKIYEEEGYNTNEIPALILEHNLFGIDIDERAAQLAAFALTMKARSYYPRFLRKSAQPHVIALENVNEDIIKQAVKLPLAVAGKLVYDYRDLTLFSLTQADNFGSLIQIDPEELKALQIQKGSIWQEQEQKLKEQAEYLSRQYHCVVTNPPYMGNGGMNSLLKTYVDKFYNKTKNDLMVAFMHRCSCFLFAEGYLGMINFASWMFLSSFEDYRNELIEIMQIESLLHNGRGIFGSDFGSVTFVLKKSNKDKEPGIYRRLFSRQVEVRTVEKIKELFLDTNAGRFEINQSKFKNLPGYPLGYWLSGKFLSLFDSTSKVKDYFISGGRCKTHNEKKYIRKIWEVAYHRINSKWRYFENGGDARLWYGNIIDLVDWSDDARFFYKEKGGITKEEFWQRDGLTWNMITYQVTFRHKLNNSEYSSGSPVLFIKNEFNNILSIPYSLAFLNSIVVEEMLKVINPTVNTSVGVVMNLPFPVLEVNHSIEEKALDNIALSKIEWDYKETSIDFQEHELFTFKNNIGSFIGDLINSAIVKRKELFYKVKDNEEQINKYFIELFGLENELCHSIPAQNITLFQSETKINVGTIHFSDNELIISLISYFSGISFGRFSLDKYGLILANQGETSQEFRKQVPNPTFMPDEDNIIPVLDGEWFTDDIVGRFKEFLKTAFGEEYFEENLKYIEDTIGKDIRKYFVKDFYNDHIKRYKKRPIYWMFSSPKGHFKALIYMHRYQPDTCSKLLNDYLQAFIVKLDAARHTQTMFSLKDDISAREKILVNKEIDKLDAMIKDCREYEKTLFSIATQRISIDLDDGVKVNYQKFKDVLVPIKGLEKEEA